MTQLANTLLRDAFGRVADELPSLLDGLTPDQVLWRPEGRGNSIGWLVWHLTRVQDDHLAGVDGRDQVWTSGGWARRFGLPYDDAAIGYGQSADEVAVFEVSDAELLVGYHAAVHEMTLSVLDAMSDADYERIVDERWDPPVTAAVRLVSVVGDITQHVGQAAYVRGLT
ncbi:mycothiol transferase [Rudaeicoccus suwonensis]|uniref:Uncharacterized protein DUF664 n=1 Tax=Rudaeicoccus suwonensis TaxID=657409 RepID=A0A561E3B4_9MICO|nr:DinB family protein [Rudaeicoccus suwonensis]TWE10097.1 uncharacterized protein DUF664 [Rudaeicoccus suwonensis]